MRKNNNAIIVGAVLILIGAYVIGHVFDLITFSLFFDGWWTMFIIIPCLVGIINNRGGRVASGIGLVIGVVLLLCAQGLVKWGMFAPLALAAIFVMIGLKMIISGTGSDDKINDYNNTGGYREYKGNGSHHTDAGKQNEKTYTYTYDSTARDTTNQYSGFQSNQTNTNGYAGQSNQTQSNSQSYQQTTGNGNNANFKQGSAYQNADTNRETCVCTAVLSGRNIRFDNEVFRGAMLSAFLGGIELDLRNAIISGTVTVEARVVLGGIEIWAPSYARVISKGDPILGSVENTTRTPAGADDTTPTIIINSSCILGGVEIK